MRITAGSVALALHLVAFGLLILPARPAAPPAPQAPQDLVVEFIAQVVSKPEPVPPIPTPPRPPKPQPRTTPTPTTVPVQLAESALPMPVAISVPEHIVPGPTSTSGPISRGAQIAYDQASPPPYPSLARRRSWEGTVLLRVRVDAAGRPVEVVIERSSGHSLLDRSASEHVLARWRFQPAIVDGRAVTAWARVPIQFNLEKG